MSPPIKHNRVLSDCFNKEAVLPYELRLDDFQIGMQDVYDFFHDVNTLLAQKGLQRLDDMLRPAIMSGGAGRNGPLAMGAVVGFREVVGFGGCP